MIATEQPKALKSTVSLTPEILKGHICLKPDEASGPSKETQGKCLTILVVDDEAFIREFLKNTFTFLKCKVDLCEDGEKALEVLQTKSYDLIFLDIILPGQNGVEILRKIKATNKSLPVYMMTGYADDKLIGQALSLGAVACLKKPFQIAEIKEIVNKHSSSL